MGEFNVGLEASGAHGSGWNWCHYVGAAAACAIVAFAGVLLWPAPSGPSPASHPPRLADCQVGYDNWQTGWSAAKQEFCCREAGRGCRVSHSAAAAAFDCDAKDAAVWSQAKQKWCCAERGVRCPAE
mmetsp:Transcript_28945/g.82274  ORF Transcript_28945/g.82274 Transcript_28945/m.82274 type:complete len:127 (+) Transcript_28945:2-382(+)